MPLKQLKQQSVVQFMYSYSPSKLLWFQFPVTINNPSETINNFGSFPQRLKFFLPQSHGIMQSSKAHMFLYNKSLWPKYLWT